MKRLLLAFTLLLPLTYAILAVLLLLTLSYWDVVTLYTRAGGSYIVARENLKLWHSLGSILYLVLWLGVTILFAVQVRASRAPL